MPSKTPKQQRFMALCKHNPGKATKKCPPRKVAAEFVAADKAAKRK